jgi:large subunit ribosomal protein L14e
LIDGPKDGASRQVISLSHLNLLPHVLPKFPRGARSGTVAKKWASADVEKKFESTRHAKKMAIREKRGGLSDFERFVVSRLKKQVQFHHSLNTLLIVSGVSKSKKS